MKGFRRMFAPDRLTLGVFFPIEAFERDQPSMRHQEYLARRAEELGFAALWFRDVPLRDPSFGDIGQVFDPWVYLGWIAAQTREIALATGSIVLPLRHPLHTAKAAASVDQLSGGRLVLGLASGDRPVEFPAFGIDFDQRATLFRENLQVIRSVLDNSFRPRIRAMANCTAAPTWCRNPRADCRCWSPAIAGSAWTGLRSMPMAGSLIREALIGRGKLSRTGGPRWKPPRPARSNRSCNRSMSISATIPTSRRPLIHLGFRGGRNFVLRFLEALQAIGVNHVILNLKYGARDAGAVLEEIGKEVLPQLKVGHAGRAIYLPLM